MPGSVGLGDEWLVEPVAIINHSPASALVDGQHRVDAIIATVGIALVGQSWPSPVNVEEVFLVVTVDDKGMAAFWAGASEINGLGHLELVVEPLHPFVVAVQELLLKSGIGEIQVLGGTLQR